MVASKLFQHFSGFNFHFFKNRFDSLVCILVLSDGLLKLMLIFCASSG